MKVGRLGTSIHRLVRRSAPSSLAIYPFENAPLSFTAIYPQSTS